MGKCITPFTKDGYHLPCGKCLECKATRISGWSFRLIKQSEISTSAIFLTLTYNTDHVPITDKHLMTLDKTDLQKFFKRLRKLHPKNTQLKYYACGEYGGHTRRPHYHIILFNADQNLLEKAWKLGTYFIGDVQGASIAYTLKYIDKPTHIPQWKGDDRQKEFSLMSKKMGLNYISKNTIKWHKKDLLNRMYIPLKDGQKIIMPKYFKEKIYNKLQRNQISQHLENKEKLINNNKDLPTKLKEIKQDELILLNKYRKNNNETRLKTSI